MEWLEVVVSSWVYDVIGKALLGIGKASIVFTWDLCIMNWTEYLWMLEFIYLLYFLFMDRYH